MQNHGRLWQPAFDRHVGKFTPGQEHYASQELRKLLVQYDLAAINTHSNAGHTLFGCRGRRFRIDFLVGPEHILQVVQSCGTLGKLGRQLQAIMVKGQGLIYHYSAGLLAAGRCLFRGARQGEVGC